MYGTERTRLGQANKQAYFSIEILKPSSILDRLLTVTLKPWPQLVIHIAATAF